MEYINVQGEQVPALGLGTWQINGKECEKIVKNALDIGYRHIDTAQAYDNEEHVGKAIEESDVDREDIWLTTKIWRSNFRHGDVKRSFEESLEKLRTDYVDLLLIHWPHEEIPFRETLDAMAELVEEGKVRNIGISNFASDQIDEAQEVSDKDILTDQVEYHPFLSQEAVLEKVRSYDMMLTAYSPLARGDVMGNSTIKRIADDHNKTEAQVALRWLIQQDNVAAIPKAASREHQEQNFDIFDFRLSSSEMDELSSLARNDRKVDPGFAPDWDRR
ncbi:MAG: aldo/keto reductase [Candidatus Nanohaloarchaea archaeon]